MELFKSSFERINIEVCTENIVLNNSSRLENQKNMSSLFNLLGH